MAYNIIDLEDIYNAMEEKDVQNLLKDFECPLNNDVEDFIKNKAIEFCKQGIARTYIVSTSYKNKQVIVGYFSLTNKINKIKRNLLKLACDKVKEAQKILGGKFVMIECEDKEYLLQMLCDLSKN